MRYRAAWSLAASLVGCGDGSTPGEARGDPRAVAGEPAAVPDTREAFLAELAPAIGRGVRVVYGVTGPAGLSGELELLAGAGAARRESWTVTRPASDGEPTVARGTVIQTPDVLWTAVESEPERRTAAPLGPLADAFARRDRPTRARIVASLRRWHADLERARREHPGQTQEIAGTSCLSLRIGTASLCVWEETGLPLAYDGAGFSITATRVETDVALDEATFAVPGGATPDPAGLAGFDAERALDDLARGDYTGVSGMLAPGLRLPALAGEVPP
jgi:hypothetical protein